LTAVHSLALFLLASWVLFCIPVILFYFASRQERRAYHLSIVYAGVMILNGLGHNFGLLITGRYFDGFAGGYTGIMFVLVGPTLIYYLRKEMPPTNPSLGLESSV